MSPFSIIVDRHGLAVDTRAAQATGTAEREAALAMVAAIPGRHRVTLGADKHDDPQDFVREVRELRATPHVAQPTKGRTRALDGRTTRHPGSPIRQRKRKQVEEIFGWLKTVGLLRQTRHRGVGWVGWTVTVAAAVSNLVRMRPLAAMA